MTTQDEFSHELGGLERRKFLGPFSKAQLLTMLGGTLGSVPVMNAGAGLFGAAIALGVVGVTVALALIPMPTKDGASSRTLGEWLPVATGFLGRKATGTSSWRTTRQELPKVSREKLPLPRSLKGVQTWSVDTGLGPVGLVVDEGKPVGAMRIHGRTFALLGRSEQLALVEAWGEVLAAFADGGYVDRIQWVDTTGALDSGRLAAWVDGRARPANELARESYNELVAGRSASQARETHFALRVDPARAAKQVKQHGRRAKGAVRVAGAELERAANMLRDAGMTVDAPLSYREYGRALRVAFDPEERGSLRVREAEGLDAGVDADDAWPVAVEENWTVLRTDTAYHRTFWAEELPRTAQQPDFLLRLLSWAPTVEGTSRTVSVTFAPVDPETARKEAEGASSGDDGEDGLREKMKRRKTARQKRETEKVNSHEEELADGHEDLRLSLYVTISAPSLDALEMASQEARNAASRARIRLRVLAGQQEDARTYTLPMCRGVA